jgi:hypothetical protein
MLLLLGQRGCRITGELPQSSVAKYMADGEAELSENAVRLNADFSSRINLIFPSSARDISDFQKIT